MTLFLIKKMILGGGRAAILKLPHGKVLTPAFMPIATRGAVKHISPNELENLGADIILSNTYHLIQRPGLETLKKTKGLHRFMQWSGPLLTDSGGFQVFSLARLRKITNSGVTFNSELDGKKIELTPESVIDAQVIIGSDIIMILDECPPWPSTHEYAKNSLETTLQWARRAKKHFEQIKKRKKWDEKKRPLLFGIIQGSTFEDLRERSIKEMCAIGFDGYAIGGVAVGEPPRELARIASFCTKLLPSSVPRYLMGVGKPEDIVMAVSHGIDLFDCVIPTREARHGRLYIRNRKKNIGAKNFYSIMNIKNGAHAHDISPVDPDCRCGLCPSFSRAYLRHLFSTQEGLALRLATLHNLSFYLSLMREIRNS